MRIIYRVFSCVAWAFFLLACDQSHEKDPVDQFREKHPQESMRYSYIQPVRVETYEAIYEIKSTMILGMSSDLKEMFNDIPDVVSYAERMKEIEGDATAAWNDFLGELREAESVGGTICQFEWQDDGLIEHGLLAIKDGDIISRMEWTRHESP